MVKGLGFFPIIFILLLTVSFARAEVDITNDASDDIVTFAPAGTANTDTNATQVVNDGGGGGGSTATTPTANTPISIPCVDDSGKSTATTGAGLCSAILPKCSNIRTNYEKTVKNFLTWKIWGYYQGKNVDLNASTLSATGTNLVGTDLMYPICSVVGHKMQFSGTSPLLSGNFNPCDDTRQKMAALYDSLGIEYSHQSIGKKAACGARPDTDSGTTYLTLSFRGGNGNLWNSYMVGAYPWLIRRHAYDVLTALKPDLSNLSDVVSSASVKTDLAAVGTMMNAYYADLATASTEVCSNTSIIDKCNNGTITMTDPAHRLCTLVKAQSTVNSGALPNIIVMEIMARVQRDFDGYFAHVLDPTRPPLKLLWDKCSNTGALFRSNRGKKALSASCLFDGGDFLTLQGMATVEDNCDGTASRHGFFTANYRIDTGAVEGDSDSPISALKLGGTNHTLMLGFGSMIESIIRHNICGQNNVNDVSVCDTVNIPDQPDGVK